MEKRQSPQQVVLRILDSYVEKNEIRTFPHINTKINSNWYHYFGKQSDIIYKS